MRHSLILGAFGLAIACSSGGGGNSTTGATTGGTTAGNTATGGTSGGGSTGTTGTSTGGSNICPGGCGPNSSCVGGQCVCFSGGYLACGTTDAGVPICVNTQADNANCGGCGVVCPSPISSCLDGSCNCLATTCPAGPSADAGTVCTDTASNPNNCGACAYGGGESAQHICEPGADCVSGTCACLTGFVQCAGIDGGAPYCADTTSDPNNCGACGTPCGHDQKCVPNGSQGTCVCNTTEDGGANLIPCGGGCVHKNSDPLNCGGCNMTCPAPGTCSQGNCTCNEDGGILQCSPGTCTNVTTDLSNCGACGNDCTLGGTLQLPNVVCKASRCLCQGGQDSICFDSASFPTLACIDTRQDPLNCGGCGLSDAGPLPDGGIPSSSHVCDGVKNTCVGGVCNCPLSQHYCAPGTWTADAGDEDAGICLDTTTDSLNCGGCGASCDQSFASGATCNRSKCQCAADAGLCVTADDPFNPTCGCSADACTGVTLTFSKDIYPLLSTSGSKVESWGTLVGCATTGCHDSTAAGGLAFTVFLDDGGEGAELDGSYQLLVNRATKTLTCNGVANTKVVDPSGNCSCQSLIIPDDGVGSLMYQLVDNSFVCCAKPFYLACNAMPKVLANGVYHPLSGCLIAQIREWIDQGAAY